MALRAANNREENAPAAIFRVELLSKERIGLRTSAVKALTGAAVTLLVLGMTMAPAFADSGQGGHHSGKKHNHGQQQDRGRGKNNGQNGWSNFFGAKGQADFSAVLGERFSNPFGSRNPLGPGGPLGRGGPFGPGTPFGPGGAMGPQGGNGNGHFQGHGISRQVMIQEVQAALNYFNPLVQTAESQLQAAVQTAQNGGASGNASVWTASDAALQQQMQAVLAQMASSQNPQQMVDLVHQLSALVGQLHQAIDQSMQQSSSGSQLVAKDQQLLTRGGAYYTRLSQDMQTILGWLQNNSGNVPVRVRQEVRNVFDRYVTFSLYFTGDMNSAVAQLQGVSPSGPGTPTPVPTPSGTVDAAASTVVDPGSAVVAGQNFTVAGSVYGSNGAQLSQVPVTVSFDGVSTTVITASNGAYTATLSPKTAVANAPVTVTADSVAISNSSDTGTVVAGQPASLTSSLTSPLSVLANSQNTVTYTVTDQYGNPVSGVPVQFSLAQQVSTSSEAQNETQEAGGALITSTGNTIVDTNSSGQVTVTYKASATADGDGDLQDVLTATVSGPDISNTQAVFTY